MSNVGQAAFSLSFTCSPIILTGGVASLIPGGILPIIAITEALNFLEGLLGGANISLDSFFAHYVPLPGKTMIAQQIGRYTFANQIVAANAVIVDPLQVSMRMLCPVKSEGGYAAKLATMMALRATLAKHNQSGGTYTVATPSYVYTNCVMLRMVDVSAGESKQDAWAWQLDFEQPLLTLQGALGAQNNLMSQLTSGTQLSGNPAWSGVQPTVGQPLSLAAPSLYPAAGSSIGTGVASPS